MNFFASESVEWASKLQGIQQSLFSYRNQPIPEPVLKVQVDTSLEGMSIEGTSGGFDVGSSTGADLCKQLKELPSGKKSALKFEEICVRALKYLFEDDLTGWRTQRSSKNGLHRYDLIARVTSNHDFWNSLISDYRARYIIFEFKNYKKKITQKEIYSTEKYLFPIAMRSTAIIISRKGPNKNASRVTAGALRESGKLILSLDVEDVCKMLHKKDDGDDYMSVIYRVLDDLLETLSLIHI